jgi:DNA replication factor Dna2
MVLHPDHLLSGTSIVSSLFCMRKAVLNERFKGLEGRYSVVVCLSGNLGLYRDNKMLPIPKNVLTEIGI